MAFVVFHTKKDGSREVSYYSKDSESEKKPVNAVCGRRAAQRIEDIHRDAANFRKNLRDKKGWSKGKVVRHVARIPVEVQHYVLRNDGQEASMDTKHLIRTAEKLGLDVRTGGGRMR
jgi:hypothetical protein